MIEGADIMGKLAEWLWLAVSALAVLAYKTTNRRIDNQDSRLLEQDQKVAEIEQRIERREERMEAALRRLYEKIEANRLENKNDLHEIRDMVQKLLSRDH